MGGLDKGDFTRVTPGMDGMFFGGLLVSGECCICSKNFLSYMIRVPGERQDELVSIPDEFKYINSHNYEENISSTLN